eukprot:m.151782 g.151782  ORF g.151782 m.151782 type:complete len:884 (-) comp16346_c0_seq3:254-2905(-)
MSSRNGIDSSDRHRIQTPSSSTHRHEHGSVGRSSTTPKSHKHKSKHKSAKHKKKKKKKHKSKRSHSSRSRSPSPSRLDSSVERYRSKSAKTSSPRQRVERSVSPSRPLYSRDTAAPRRHSSSSRLANSHSRDRDGHRHRDTRRSRSPIPRRDSSREQRSRSPVRPSHPRLPTSTREYGPARPLTSLPSREGPNGHRNGQHNSHNRNNSQNNRSSNGHSSDVHISNGHKLPGPYCPSKAKKAKRIKPSNTPIGKPTDRPFPPIVQRPKPKKPIMATSNGTTSLATRPAETKMPESEDKTALQKLLDGEMEGLDLNADVATELDHVEGACIECEERAATHVCDQCEDEYCSACYTSLHRRGKRLDHTFVLKDPVALRKPHDQEADTASEEPEPTTVEPALDNLALLQLERNSPEWFVERAKHIPVRLQMNERKWLRMLEGALLVSSYTDKVDRTDFKTSTKRAHTMVTQLCSMFTGMILAFRYDAGCKVADSRAFPKPCANLLRHMFEVGRRHKIMNPERMRTQYGKLVFMLQDALSPKIKGLLETDVMRDIVTVHSWLTEHEIVDVLRHPLLATATMEILPEGKSRSQIQRDIKAKEGAQDKIARDFVYKARSPKGKQVSKDDIKWCLYSMSDNNSFLRVNRFPVDYMIDMLQHYFKPDSAQPGFDLSIAAGEGNARLTHSHEHQYHYVLQTLTLWQKILDDFFRLWHLAEQDLLDCTGYTMTDTGQGHHRQQPAPRIYAAMRAILQQTQQELGTWIGSSVIHLGDNNVPNALVFIDKYTQVARILGPVVQTLKALPKLAKEKRIETWFETAYGGVDNLRTIICHDLFSKGFDGSGADNFYDAGSCIDGRLTSAWNWCQQLPSKPFYPVFSLAGFTSFDGEFQD